MNRDLIRDKQLRFGSLCFSVISFALALTGCSRGDAKLEEKRILSDINQVTEQSRRKLRSDETTGALRRLNELRSFFPERREEIDIEARAVRTAFGQVLSDDKKIAELWQQLLRLPLSDAYRKCATAQADIGELTSVGSQRIFDEMNVLLDPTVSDRQTLDEKLNSLRRNTDEVDESLREREMFLDQNCRQPSNSLE